MSMNPWMRAAASIIHWTTGVPVPDDDPEAPSAIPRKLVR